MEPLQTIILAIIQRVGTFPFVPYRLVPGIILLVMFS